MKLLTRLKLSLSSPRRKLFFNLIVFHAAYQWAKNFSSAVLNPYFLFHGLKIPQLFVGDLIFFLTAFLFQLVLSKLSSRLSWRLATISAFTAILIISRLTSVYHFYVANFFAGLSLVFFYVVYNTVHFKLTPQHRTGISSAILFSVFPVIGLIAPLLAGILAHHNYLYIWLLSGLFFGLAFYLSRFQTNLNISFKPSLKSISPTRVLIFLEGVWEIVYFSVVAYYSLHFITTPLSYGTYLSYLSLLSIISNLVLGRLTDKLQKRIVFLYPLTLAMALVTFLFPLALNSFFWWLVVTGALRFFVPQFWNLITSVMVDTTANIPVGFATREFVLSFGRSLGLVLVLINFQFQARPTYIFYFFGSLMLLFPLILFYRSRISKKYSYL